MTDQTTGKDCDLHVRAFRLAIIVKNVEGWTKDDRKDPAKSEQAVEAMAQLGVPPERAVQKVETILALG